MPSIKSYSTIVHHEDIEAKINNNKPFSPLTKQLFASSGSLILSVICGIIVGFSATALPQLTETFHLNEDTKSWVASITALAMPIGGLVGYILLDYYPRRKVLIICSILSIVGWLSIALAASLFVLYIGRFLTGLYIGLITPSACIYVAEISEPHYRGLLVGMLAQSASLGMLLVHVLGTYLNWRIVSYVCICIQLLALIPIFFSPETPTWLICNGFVSKAETSFYWLRPNRTNNDEELKGLLRKYVRTKVYRSPWTDAKSIFSVLFLKPFSITAVFFITQQFSGSSIVIFYTVGLIQKISPTINEYNTTLVVDIVRLLASCASCWLLKQYNRKSLLVVSSTGSIVSIVGLAISTPYAARDGAFASLPIVFLIAYVLFATIGLIPLPWIIASEIFPVAVRELGNGLSTCFAFLMVFVTVKIAPTLFGWIGLSMTYALLAAITFIGSVILCFILPETNNKSLQQVEEDMYET